MTQERGGLSRLAARGAVWAVLERSGEAIVQIAVLAVLARRVPPGAFGLIALTVVVLTLVRVLVDQGVAKAIVQRSTISNLHLDSSFWFTMVAALLLGGLIFITANPIAAFFNEASLARLLRMVSVVPLLRAVGTVPAASLQRDMAFKSTSTRGLISALAGGTVAIGLALAGYDAEALVGQIVVASATSSAVLLYLSEWKPRWRFSIVHLREIFSLGSSVLATDIIGFVNRNADDTIVGAELGSNSLGFYSVGYRLFTTLTTLLIVPLTAVALPAFARLQDDVDALGRSFLRVIRMSSSLAFPAFVGMSILAPEIIEVMFGPAWAEAAPVMRIVSLVGVIHAVTFFHHTVLVAMGRPRISLWITISYAVVNVAGFLFAVQYGITAVAAAYALRALVIAPIEAHVTARQLDISIGEYVRALTPAVAATAFMGLVVFALDFALPSTWGTLLIAVPTGIAVYGLALRVVAPTVISEARTYLKTAGSSTGETNR